MMRQIYSSVVGVPKGCQPNNDLHSITTCCHHVLDSQPIQYLICIHECPASSSHNFYLNAEKQ